MTTPLPIIDDIKRVRGETYPDVYVPVGTDLTGHTATLVVLDASGVEIDRVTGSITVISSTSSSILFTPSTNMVATAFGVATASYSVILDVATPALRRTIATGDWIVTDYPG